MTARGEKEKPPETPVIGIVGGIGSGKSTVSAALEELGARRLDADRMAHECLDDPDASREIRERFGDEVFDADGSVDRQALGRRVFADRDELEALERIVHPRVSARLATEVEASKRDASVPMIIIDAPLLLEVGLDRLCDRILFVDVEEATRLERIKRSRGWDLQEVKRREKFQKPLKEKKSRADYRIDNNHPTGSLRDRVKAIWQQIAGSSGPIP